MTTYDVSDATRTFNLSVARLAELTTAPWRRHVAVLLTIHKAYAIETEKIRFKFKRIR